MTIKQFLYQSVLLILTLQGMCVAHDYPGLLCVIEGMDGAGKTTLLQNLKLKFTQTNLPITFTKEPGATELGKHLRQILNDRIVPVSTKAEFLLFASDRAEHFDKEIIPDLKQGKIIVSDRMADSSVAYQGYLKGLDIEMIKTVNAWCMHSIIPDLVIYLRITPNQAKQRIELNRGFATAFEQEFINRLDILFHGFEQIFQSKPNAIIIDALQDPEEIATIVFEMIQQKFLAKSHATH